MTGPTYDTLDVPVRGGALRVGRWTASDPAAPVVLAVHGVTANHLAWQALAALDRFTVVAPDLRGRGASAGLRGPYGLERHAADVTAVLDSLGADGDPGAEASVLVGHSMGAYVATLATAGVARERMHGLVLVDGGLSFPTPPGADIDAILSAVIGPSLDRSR